MLLAILKRNLRCSISTENKSRSAYPLQQAAQPQTHAQGLNHECHPSLICMRTFSFQVHLCTRPSMLRFCAMSGVSSRCSSSSLATISLSVSGSACDAPRLFPSTLTLTLPPTLTLPWVRSAKETSHVSGASCHRHYSLASTSCLVSAGAQTRVMLKFSTCCDPLPRLLNLYRCRPTRDQTVDERQNLGAAEQSMRLLSMGRAFRTVSATSSGRRNTVPPTRTTTPAARRASHR